MNADPIYPKRKRISCGCCTGDGTGVHAANDQCVCSNHQDTPNGKRPHVCWFHAKGFEMAEDLVTA